MIKHKPTVGEIIESAPYRLVDPLFQGCAIHLMFNEGGGPIVANYGQMSQQGEGFGSEATLWTSREGLRSNAAGVAYATVVDLPVSKFLGSASVLADVTIFTDVAWGVISNVEVGAGETEAENSIFGVDTAGTGGTVDIRYAHEYSAGSNQSNDFNTNLVFGTQYWLAMTRNVETQDVKLRVFQRESGEELFSGTYNYTNQPTNTSSTVPLYLGKRVSGTSNSINVEYRDFRLYSRWLMDCEVDEIIRDPYALYRVSTWRSPFSVVSASGQTVTPSSVTIPTVLPAPTVTLGVVTVAPSPVTIPSALPAPTVSLGAVTLTPSPVTIPTALPDPTVTQGIVVTPSPVAVPSVIPAPTVSLGAVTVTPSPVTIPAVLPAPVVTQAGIITPDPVAIPTALPAPTVSLGAVTLTPSPVTIPSVIPAPTVTQGTVISPDSVTIPTAIPVPTISLGAISVTPDPVTIPAVLPDPSVGIGAQTLTPSPVTATVAIPDPTVVLGAITLTPTPVTIPAIIPDPLLTGSFGSLGSVAVLSGHSLVTPTLVSESLVS